jgi:hypothetical protein
VQRRRKSRPVERAIQRGHVSPSYVRASQTLYTPGGYL